ncbi:Putative structural protein [Cellulophaga phage phi14:2]|uniref:Uncharacterized protein n=1 Tax=Cellulophaga phage phi14:2 TaxID=1327990 RepID=S0A085_9CAUD|nr:Putative structural protein [Cellulophaga phage phi14:2]AGO48979.1 hypothetical protein Phi14:2_gp101 [Cellulophaga phage phi14:2]
MGTETVLEKTSFTLPDKKIIVRFIRKRKGMAADVKDDHVIAGGMLNGSFKKIPVPMQKNGSLANVLTKEEKAFLESDEGLGKGLSVYANKEFWQDRYVTLVKGDNFLDLSDPIDYIDYKILLGNSDKIAPSLAVQSHKATYQYVIVDSDEEMAIERDTFNYKKEAFKLYSKVEDNEAILRGILKIVNKRPVSEASKITWLRQEVEKLVDGDSKKFVEFMKDSDYEYKILLSNAEDAGVVITHNQKYSTSDGIELAEIDEIPSFANAVRYLANPKNSELVDIIKVKLEKTTKRKK